MLRILEFRVVVAGRGLSSYRWEFVATYSDISLPAAGFGLIQTEPQFNASGVPCSVLSRTMSC